MLTWLFAFTTVLFLSFWLLAVRKQRRYIEQPPFVLAQHEKSSYKRDLRIGNSFVCFPSMHIDTTLPPNEAEKFSQIQWKGKTWIESAISSLK
jgi:hypothetical protein